MVDFSFLSHYKRRITCLNRYGVCNAGGTDESIEKAKQTCLAKYGKEFYSQTMSFATNHRKIIEYEGLKFDSKLEVKFYEKCKQLNLEVKYQPTSFTYIDCLGYTHKYFPDFEVNGKLYELKGDHL